MLGGLLLDMLSEVVRDENITSEVSTLYCVKVMVKRVRSFVYIFVRVPKRRRSRREISGIHTSHFPKTARLKRIRRRNYSPVQAL